MQRESDSDCSSCRLTVLSGCVGMQLLYGRSGLRLVAYRTVLELYCWFRWKIDIICPHHQQRRGDPGVRAVGQ